MTSVGELLIGLTMAIGLIGTIVPVFPGILLVWTSGLVWTVADGGGVIRWSLFALMTVLATTGLVASVRIPSQSTRSQNAPQWTLLISSTFAVIGFFVIPVLGVFIGFALGVLLSHLIETKDFSESSQQMWITVQAFGKAALIQAVCATAIVGVWVLGLIFT